MHQYHHTPTDGLHVDSVLKSFGRRQILTDVHLSCKRGEVVGLIGRNGSGKSTLMKVIFGSLMAERSFVRIDECINGSRFRNRERIRYLPQYPFLPRRVPVERLFKLYGVTLDENIKQFGPVLEGLTKKKPGQLSGGEARLVEILLILCSSADFILLDEPFNGLPPIYVEHIKKAILRESREKGIVLTDHDYRNVLDVARHILLLYDGGTKTIRDPSELEYWGYLSAGNIKQLN